MPNSPTPGAALIAVEQIQSRILVLRGVRVILDADLAALYGVPTKRLNEQVKRNARRFPEDFMFQLTRKESVASRSQIATLNPQPAVQQKEMPNWSQIATSSRKHRGVAYLSFAFTEHSAIQAAGEIKRSRRRIGFHQGDR